MDKACSMLAIINRSTTI